MIFWGRHPDPSEALLLSGNVTGTEPESFIDSPLYLNVVRSAHAGTGSMLVRADPRREQTGPLVGM